MADEKRNASLLAKISTMEDTKAPGMIMSAKKAIPLSDMAEYK